MDYKESEVGKIPVHWEIRQLSEIGEIVSGGTPNTKIEEYWNGNIPWITPKDLSGFTDRYIYSGERNITELGLENSSAKLLPRNTVLFSSRAPIGYVALAGDNLATNQGFKSIICDDKKAYPLFIYYLLKSKKNDIENIAGGSTFKEVSGKVMKEFKVQIPPLTEQKAIANILSTLDEKIETNNQINEKLEEMAQALFKHWFVDFEFPDENGKPYKSSGGEMVESELGMIPKGWKIVKLGDVIDFQNGYAFKSKDLLDVESDSTFRVFKMGNIKKGGGINHSGTKSYIERDKCQNLSNYIIKKGDLLMCMTDMKSNVALLGHTALMDRDNEYILNQRVGLIRTKDSKVINFPYLYILTNSEDFINNLRSRANSGVQVNLSTKEIKDSLICLPDQKVHSLLNEITERMFEKSFQVEDENQKLTLIRDNLLPKLMSGEIRVPLDDEVLSEQN